MNGIQILLVVIFLVNCVLGFTMRRYIVRQLIEKPAPEIRSILGYEAKDKLMAFSSTRARAIFQLIFAYNGLHLHDPPLNKICLWLRTLVFVQGALLLAWVFVTTF
ncbi:MAG: hypothetical protein ABI443_11105 [Chthoniobacterales bacterium]